MGVEGPEPPLLYPHLKLQRPRISQGCPVGSGLRKKLLLLGVIGRKEVSP